MARKKKLDKIDKMILARQAPLVEVDCNELGDTRLNPVESNAQLREGNLQKASKFKLCRQEELEDPERGMGPKLPFHEILTRIQKEAPELKARDGSPGNIALYYPRNMQELTEELQQGGGTDEFFIFHKYVGGFPKEDIPEFSWVDIDSSHLATREHRGWRSILITLLKQGVLSYAATVRQFGDVGTDSRGWRWLEQTQRHRERPNEKFPQTMIGEF